MILNPPDRFFIFCTVEKETSANQMAAAWDPATRGDLTFGLVRLSATGQEPASHLACSTVASPEMRAGIESAFTHVPFAFLYREGEGWSWESACQDAGLKLVEVQEE